MSQLTTHILDTSTGLPATNVQVKLYAFNENNWLFIAEGKTNTSGRLTDLLTTEQLLKQGTYKLHFDTAGYFAQTTTRHFFPFVEIVFSVSANEHYHVPLLLNPFGYSTYRGS